jgi:hypothetical protein
MLLPAPACRLLCSSVRSSLADCRTIGRNPEPKRGKRTAAANIPGSEPKTHLQPLDRGESAQWSEAGRNGRKREASGVLIREGPWFMTQPAEKGELKPETLLAYTTHICAAASTISAPGEDQRNRAQEDDGDDSYRPYRRRSRQSILSRAGWRSGK